LKKRSGARTASTNLDRRWLLFDQFFAKSISNLAARGAIPTEHVETIPAPHGLQRTSRGRRRVRERCASRDVRGECILSGYRVVDAKPGGLLNDGSENLEDSLS